MTKEGVVSMSNGWIEGEEAESQNRSDSGGGDRRTIKKAAKRKAAKKKRTDKSRTAAKKKTIPKKTKKGKK